MSAWLEQAWLARYLDRQLSDDEVAEFEAYLLDKPHLIEQVEADNLLRDTLHAADQVEISGDATGDSTSNNQPSHLASWLPIAASIVGAFAIGWMLPRQSAVEDTYFVAPERVVYDTFRGEVEEPAVYPGRRELSAVYILEVAVPPSAQIVGLRAQALGKSIELPIGSASSEGFLTLVLPREWRGAGQLLLTFEAPDSGEIHNIDVAL